MRHSIYLLPQFLFSGFQRGSFVIPTWTSRRGYQKRGGGIYGASFCFFDIAALRHLPVLSRSSGLASGSYSDLSLCLPALKCVLQKCDKNSRQSSRSNCHEPWPHFTAAPVCLCLPARSVIWAFLSCRAKRQANWQTPSAKP